MKKFLLSLVTLLATASAFAATTYTYTGNAYTTATGTFTTSMKITGSFTTATPLAPNLPLAAITGLVTSYSFSDGVNSYDSSDANSRIMQFQVSTDAAGQVSTDDPAGAIVLEVWESGTSPHSPGDLSSTVMIYGASGNGYAFDTLQCTEVGTSPYSGVGDVCFGSVGPGLGSAFSPAGSWFRQIAATSIPTLSEWGMVILFSLLALGALFTLRRKRQ